MITILLAAALAAQQPELRDVAAVSQLLGSLRTADPAVCEMAGRTLTNQWGWGGDFSDEAMPSPMPMPVPMPMPFAAEQPFTSSASAGRQSQAPETGTHWLDPPATASHEKPSGHAAP